MIFYALNSRINKLRQLTLERPHSLMELLLTEQRFTESFTQKNKTYSNYDSIDCLLLTY